MTKRIYLVWFALAAVNLGFAINGRGRLYYLAAAMFVLAGIVGRWKQPKL